MKTNDIENDVREMKEEYIMKTIGKCDSSVSMMGNHWTHMTKE